MKYLLLMVLFTGYMIVSAQKRPIKTRAQYRDSTWHEVKHDTLYGTIEFTKGFTTIRGEGMLVHLTIQQFTTLGPTKLIEYGYTSQEVVNRYDGYLLTSTGYQEINDKHIFTPYTKPYSHEYKTIRGDPQ
jgi:hypothetical protein